VAGETARAHFAKQSGRAGPFGAIRGYLFRTGFESAIELAIDGTARGPHDGAVPEGRASLRFSHGSRPMVDFGTKAITTPP
jgi:hypothetical protein